MLDIKLVIDGKTVVNETNASEDNVSDYLYKHFGEFTDIYIFYIMTDVRKYKFAKCSCGNHIPPIEYYIDATQDSNITN